MKLLMRWLVVHLIKFGTNILCRIEKTDFAKVPANGPLIIVSNHIGSLEVPLMYAHLWPRRMIGLAKIETWDSKFMGWLFSLWDAIPIRRGEADLEALRGCQKVLQGGDMLIVAPEGTRSGDGILLPGQPGIALIALRAGTPILPVAHWGAEDFPANVKRGRRTDFHVRVGRPFTLDTHGQKVNGEMRQAMADEIMCQIARLMPEKYRGPYAACDAAGLKYLRFA